MQQSEKCRAVMRIEAAGAQPERAMATVKRPARPSGPTDGLMAAKGSVAAFLPRPRAIWLPAADGSTGAVCQRSMDGNAVPQRSKATSAHWRQPARWTREKAKCLAFSVRSSQMEPPSSVEVEHL